MQVRVKLIATYREKLPADVRGNTVVLDVPAGISVADVLARYDIPMDESSVIVLNGLTVPLDTPLSAGDEVAAFSAIAGG